LIGGIVLTGGGALLNHIDKLAEFHTGISTRIGLPIEQLGHGYDERVCNPIFSTAIGLLLKGIENPHNIDLKEEEEKFVEEPEEVVEEQGKWYEQLFHKTKEWFEAEPDSEF
jgi:cell division protein FtsA